MLSKIHTSSTNNFCLELYKPYGTCTVLWLHIIVEFVQLHVYHGIFKKWYMLKIFFFLSNTCMFMQGNKRNSCVFYSHLWRELQQQSLNSCTVIHSLCTTSVLLNALFKAFFFVFSHFHISTTIQSVAKNLNAINKMESPMSIRCVTVVL